MTKTFLKSMAVLGAVAFSTGAYASTVNVTYQGSDVFNGNGHLGSAAITSPSIPGSANVSVGAFDLHAEVVAPGTPSLVGDFVAFCIDIANWLDQPREYDLYTAADAADGINVTPSITAGVIGSIQALFNTSYSLVSANLSDTASSAGFQLALWEILFETDDEWNVTSGAGFSFTSSSAGTADATTAANDMLAAALANDASADNYQSYDLTFLQAHRVEGSNHGQNLVTAAPSPVPVPAAGFLLLFGLAGLGVAARRRKSA